MFISEYFLILCQPKPNNMETTKKFMPHAKTGLSFLCITVLFFALSLSSCKNTDEKTLVKNITYDVLINNENATPGMKEFWWKNNIEQSKREAFLKLLFEKIDSNAIHVTDGEGKVLGMDEIKNKMIINDTVVMMRQTESLEYFDTIITITVTPEQINMIRFRESWTYDPVTFEITKHLQSYGLCYVKKNAYSRTYHAEPFFWVSCADKENFSDPKKVLTERIAYSLPLFEKGNVEMLNTIELEGDTNDIRTYLNSMWSNVLEEKLKNVKDLDYATLEFSEISLDTIIQQALRSIRKNFTTTVSNDEIEKDLLGFIMNYGKTLYFHERWLVDLNTMEISKEVQVVSPGINIYNKGLLMGSRYFYVLAFRSKMWQPL